MRQKLINNIKRTVGAQGHLGAEDIANAILEQFEIKEKKHKCAYCLKYFAYDDLFDTCAECVSAAIYVMYPEALLCRKCVEDLTRDTMKGIK
jgi:hypothetical protein